MKGGRTIKIGWKHFEKSEYIQVRSDKGGGTDNMFVPKTFTKTDLLAEAKSMFFQDGISSKGHEDDLEFDVADFRSQPLDDSITIGELFERSNRKNLRYYLFTKPKDGCKSNKSKRSVSKASHTISLDIHTDLETDDDQGSAKTVVPSTAAMNISEKSESTAAFTGLKIPTQSAEQITDPNVPGPSGLQSLTPNVVSTLLPSSPENDTLPDLYEYMGSLRTMQVTLPDGTEEDIIYNLEPDDSGIIELNYENQVIVTDEILIRVHRGHALKDLMEAFSNIILLDNTKFKIQMVLPNGTVEKAHDEGGVTRDCLAEFWETFYSNCTIGKDSKVPFLRHDYREKQWEAVGKIILFGYKEFGYFPVSIAKPFMEYCIFGEAKTDLKDTFFSYVSPSEASVLQQSLTEFSEVDQDELNEIMQSYDCRKLLTSQNMNTIIKEIAHKEILQKSMFIIDAFKTKLFGLMTEEEFQNCYRKLIPTSQGVISKLKFPINMNDKEVEMKKYLNRYIRDLDQQSLGKFMRFSTGSDLLLKEITVRFSNLDGFSRRVMAHTCGCTLDVPVSYDNYVEFRSEFNSILKSEVWVMDLD